MSKNKKNSVNEEGEGGTTSGGDSGFSSGGGGDGVLNLAGRWTTKRPRSKKDWFSSKSDTGKDIKFSKPENRKPNMKINNFKEPMKENEKLSAFRKSGDREKLIEPDWLGDEPPTKPTRKQLVKAKQFKGHTDSFRNPDKREKINYDFDPVKENNDDIDFSMMNVDQDDIEKKVYDPYKNNDPISQLDVFKRELYTLLDGAKIEEILLYLPPEKASKFEKMYNWLKELSKNEFKVPAKSGRARLDLSPSVKSKIVDFDETKVSTRASEFLEHFKAIRIPSQSLYDDDPAIKSALAKIKKMKDSLTLKEHKIVKLKKYRMKEIIREELNKQYGNLFEDEISPISNTEIHEILGNYFIKNDVPDDFGKLSKLFVIFKKSGLSNLEEEYKNIKKKHGSEEAMSYLESKEIHNFISKKKKEKLANIASRRSGIDTQINKGPEADKGLEFNDALPEED